MWTFLRNLYLFSIYLPHYSLIKLDGKRRATETSCRQYCVIIKRQGCLIRTDCNYQLYKFYRKWGKTVQVRVSTVGIEGHVWWCQVLREILVGWSCGFIFWVDSEGRESIPSNYMSFGCMALVGFFFQRSKKQMNLRCLLIVNNQKAFFLLVSITLLSLLLQQPFRGKIT